MISKLSSLRYQAYSACGPGRGIDHQYENQIQDHGSFGGLWELRGRKWLPCRLRGRSKWSGKCAGILDSDWTTDHNETFSLVTARSVLVTWICKLQSGWERAWDFRWVLFVWSKCDNGRGIINYLEPLAKALSYFIQFAWSTFSWSHDHQRPGASVSLVRICHSQG